MKNKQLVNENVATRQVAGMTRSIAMYMSPSVYLGGALGIVSDVLDHVSLTRFIFSSHVHNCLELNFTALQISNYCFAISYNR